MGEEFFERCAVACRAGALQAWRRYERWVGAGQKRPLERDAGHSIPESLLQGDIANELRAVDGIAFVTMEELLLVKGKSRRVDVVGWTQDHKMAVLIEVKRGIANLPDQVLELHASAAELDGAPALGVSCKRFSVDNNGNDGAVEWFESKATGLSLIGQPELVDVDVLRRGKGEPTRFGVAVFRSTS